MVGRDRLESDRVARGRRGDTSRRVLQRGDRRVRKPGVSHRICQSCRVSGRLCVWHSRTLRFSRRRSAKPILECPCPSRSVALSTRALRAPDGPCRRDRAVGARAQQNSADNGKEELPPKERLAAETYVKPPAAIERLVTAPRQNNVTLSTTRARTGSTSSSCRVRGCRASRRSASRTTTSPGCRSTTRRTARGPSRRAGRAGLAIIDASTGQSRDDRDAEGRERQQPAVVARRIEARLHRELRRCLAALRRRPRDRQVAPGVAARAARDARDDGRLDGGRKPARHGADSGCTQGGAEASGDRDRPARPPDGREEGEDPQLREPPPRSVREGADGVLRHRPARDDQRRAAAASRRSARRG